MQNAIEFGRFLLLPITALFALLVWFRRWLYQKNILKTIHSDVPVVVVGNISAGGSGKTPLTIALSQHFAKQGKIVGIVSRGYGGSHPHGNLIVKPDTKASIAGDEPVLLASNTKAIVVVNKNRPEAVAKAVSLGAQIIISDDGLQHYAMSRSVEIVVIDSLCGVGNEMLMPSGVLREPMARLNEVDFIIYHKRAGNIRRQSERLKNILNQDNSHQMQLLPRYFVNVLTGDKVEVGQLLAHYQNTQVHAIAGIASPKSFFIQLHQLGFKPIVKSFSDHYQFSAEDFALIHEQPVLMTQKDSVKCASFAHRNMWYLHASASIDASFFQQLDKLC